MAMAMYVGTVVTHLREQVLRAAESAVHEAVMDPNLNGGAESGEQTWRQFKALLAAIEAMYTRPQSDRPSFSEATEKIRYDSLKHGVDVLGRLYGPQAGR